MAQQTSSLGVMSFAVWYGKRQKAGQWAVNETPHKLSLQVYIYALYNICKYQHRPGNDTTVSAYTSQEQELEWLDSL